MKKSWVLSILSLLLTPILISGCHSIYESGSGGAGYCDDSGCYQCNEEDRCWPSSTSSPRSCAKDQECKGNEFCDNGSCKERCISDDQCGSGEVCAPCGKCQPEDLPAVCGAAPDFCSASVDCGAQKTCQAGRCHFQCTQDSQCPVGQLCNSGVCLDDPNPAAPECVMNLDCTSGACINGYCHQDCNSSSNCGPTEVCLMGLCQPNYSPALAKS